MKNDLVYNKLAIEKCISDILPNKVMFALGDSFEVRCASIWIKKLEEENKKLEMALREIGSGPGYPLDDCPKCDAAKKARKSLNDTEASGIATPL